jgi:L-histidine Nalpha-methyltransferase
MIIESRQEIENLSPFDLMKNDVRAGLTARNKFIPSKYFYDDKGSEIFRKIMKLPEYYLTRSEYSIFTDHKDQILKSLDLKNGFDLVEFGAGDGHKTRVLLEYFLEKQIDFEYIPVDISEESNLKLYRNLKSLLPLLKISPISHEYFRAMDMLSLKDNKPKVLLFLGSNVGNFNKAEAVEFFSSLSLRMRSGDKILIGFDLKKEPSVILNAYNDQQGITRDFNMNLLLRLNRELGADFDLEQFIHSPVYNPSTGAAKSYLLSKISQDVYITAMDLMIHFDAWEAIHTEVSQKYDLNLINSIAEKSGFGIRNNFYDKDEYFLDSLWERL